MDKKYDKLMEAVEDCMTYIEEIRETIEEAHNDGIDTTELLETYNDKLVEYAMLVDEIFKLIA